MNNKYPLGLKPYDEMTENELADELMQHINAAAISSDVARQMLENVEAKNRLIVQIQAELKRRGVKTWLLDYQVKKPF